jgi:hypothetical protein
MMHALPLFAMLRGQSHLDVAVHDAVLVQVGQARQDVARVHAHHRLQQRACKFRVLGLG